MNTTIAFNGKGGTGKTTVASLLVEYIASKKTGSILAIDADPNSNLPELLGIKDPKTIVGMVDEISKNMDKIPTGVTKTSLIETRIQQEGITEEDDFDLLVMGRPEGPGCYCYVNNLLRDIIERIAKNYSFVIIDNAAGMEHISRRTARIMDKFVLVSDYSAFGVRSAKKIYDLAKDLNIKIGEAYLILNKTTGPAKVLEDEVRRSGLELVGVIPYEEELECLSISSKPIFGLESKSIKTSVEDIFKNLTKG